MWLIHHYTSHASFLADTLLLQLSVKNCFIRGSVVRYIQLPVDEVDTALLQDATRKEGKAT